MSGKKTLKSHESGDSAFIIRLIKAHCPLGCPSDSFDCKPDKKSVSILNTDPLTQIE